MDIFLLKNYGCVTEIPPDAVVMGSNEMHAPVAGI